MKWYTEKLPQPHALVVYKICKFCTKEFYYEVLMILGWDGLVSSHADGLDRASSALMGTFFGPSMMIRIVNILDLIENYDLDERQIDRLSFDMIIL